MAKQMYKSVKRNEDCDTDCSVGLKKNVDVKHQHIVDQLNSITDRIRSSRTKLSVCADALLGCELEDDEGDKGVDIAPDGYIASINAYLCEIRSQLAQLETEVERIEEAV